MTIPKRIHYCWLSGEPLNQIAVDCMETWRRVLPDYEIVRWDRNAFDIDSVSFVKEACDARKWAFASDYIRLFSVYEQGGLYFDTDIRVIKPLDQYLAPSMFIPVEYHPMIAESPKAQAKLDSEGRLHERHAYAEGIGLQAALFGAEPGHQFLRQCMAVYEGRPFLKADGTFQTDPIAPGIYAKEAEQYGFVYRNREQHLSCDVHVPSSAAFPSSPDLATEDAVAIHWCAGSWREHEHRTLASRIKSRLRRALVG